MVSYMSIDKSQSLSSLVVRNDHEMYSKIWSVVEIDVKN